MFGLFSKFKNFDFKPKIDSGFFIDEATQSLYPKLITVNLALQIIHEHPLGNRNKSGSSAPRVTFGEFPYGFSAPVKEEQPGAAVAAAAPPPAPAPAEPTPDGGTPPVTNNGAGAGGTNAGEAAAAAAVAAVVTGQGSAQPPSDDTDELFPLFTKEQAARAKERTEASPELRAKQAETIAKIPGYVPEP